MIDIKMVYVETKERVCRKSRELWVKGCNFYNVHEPEIKKAVGLTLAAIPVGTKVVKTINRHHDERVKELRIYDPSAHRYWTLRRPMTEAETRRYEERWRNGEKRIDILEEMGLAKKF